jgi:hypothetical protein
VLVLVKFLPRGARDASFLVLLCSTRHQLIIASPKLTQSRTPTYNQATSTSLPPIAARFIQRA